MENGSQTKRPLDEKPEEINEKVSKRETMESPVEQKLQREGQDPESTGNKTSEPESQKQSDESEQTATAMPGTKKITDKQSKSWGFSLHGLRSLSFGFGGTKDERSALVSFPDSIPRNWVPEGMRLKIFSWTTL